MVEKEVRKYSRGREEVDLDSWLDRVSNGWESFEHNVIGRYYINDKGKKVTITEKDLPKLRKAYDNLYSRLNQGDNTVTYRHDRAAKGFSDSTGTLTSNDVYSGIVAKYFGNVLRGMSAYEEPKSNNENTFEYSDDAVGKLINKQIFGSAGKVQDFIDLDSDITNTTNRVQRYKNAVENLLTEVTNGTNKDIEHWTDEQKNQLKSRLETILSSDIFTDNQITNNEILDFANLTGDKNLRKLFTTTLQSEPDEQEDIEHDDDGDIEFGQENNMKSFIKWLEQNVPKYTATSGNNFNLTDNNTYNEQDIIKFKKGLDQVDSTQLINSIKDILDNLSNPNWNSNKNIEFIKNLANSGYMFNFDNSFIINTILAKLKESGKLKKIPNEVNMYYIPTMKSRDGYAIVWDVYNNKLIKRSIYDTKPALLECYNQFTNNVNARNLNIDADILQPVQAYFNKQGGILYAATGNRMDRNTGMTGNPDATTNQWLTEQDNTSRADDISTWQKYYKMDDIIKNISSTIDTNDSFLNYGTPNDPTKKFDKSTLVAMLNQLQGDDFKKLSWDIDPANKFRTGYQAWNDLFNKTGLNYYFAYNQKQNNMFGPSTYNRYALLDKLKTTYNSQNSTFGGIYYDGSKWVYNEPEVQDNGETTNVTGTGSPGGGTQNPIGGGTTGGSSTNVEERNIFLNPPKLPKDDWKDPLLPHILESGRTALSIAANNKIYDTIHNSLRPVLSHTFNTHVPITRRTDLESATAQQAANLMYNASLAQTSNPELAAARQLEAQKQASQAILNTNIKSSDYAIQTQAQHNKANEANLQRNTENANNNLERIVNNNKQLATLESSRIKKNQSSLDNLLQSIAKDTKSRLDQNSIKRHEFRETAYKQFALRDYENTIQQAEDALREWQAGHDGQSITKWDQYKKYIAFKKAAENRYKDQLLQYNSDNYNLGYKSQYGDQTLDWNSFTGFEI